MTIELEDIFALANRLDDLRVQSPKPLVSHEARQQRDYPISARLSLIGPKRDHKHHNVAPAHSWNWKSKQP